MTLFGCCCAWVGITVYHLPSKGKGVPITSCHTLGPENRGGDVRRHGPDIDLTPGFDDEPGVIGVSFQAVLIGEWPMARGDTHTIERSWNG